MRLGGALYLCLEDAPSLAGGSLATPSLARGSLATPGQRRGGQRTPGLIHFVMLWRRPSKGSPKDKKMLKLGSQSYLFIVISKIYQDLHNWFARVKARPLARFELIGRV